VFGCGRVEDRKLGSRGFGGGGAEERNEMGEEEGGGKGAEA